MNYSLSSSRKIGDYIQKIITTQNDSQKATTTYFLSSLKKWHTLFSSLNPEGRYVGDIEYNCFTETDSSKHTSFGTKADIIFTVLSTINSLPKITTMKVYDVTKENAATIIKEEYQGLTNYSINSLENYLISALVNLHD